MVKLEGTKPEVLPVADVETVAKSPFQKCSGSILPLLLPFPWSSNIQLQSLILSTAGHPLVSEASELLMATVTSFSAGFPVREDFYGYKSIDFCAFGC